MIEKALSGSVTPVIRLVACVATSIAVAIQVTDGQCLKTATVETPPPAAWDLDSPAGYGQTVRMWTMLKLAPKAIKLQPTASASTPVVVCDNVRI